MAVEVPPDVAETAGRRTDGLIEMAFAIWRLGEDGDFLHVVARSAYLQGVADAFVAAGWLANGDAEPEYVI